ncbi:MAG: dockerin type I domain-containing protein [Pseudomonadales bacterium]
MKQSKVWGNVLAVLTLLLLTTLASANTTPFGKTFWHFESGQVRPLALSPDGSRLFAINTPDNHLEIFQVTASGLTFVESIAVGLEPVAVAARSNTEVWVVNHLSDSISVLDVSVSPARLVRTLLVGDEPRDIVFAGTPPLPGAPFPRAFITTAHRGQVNPDEPSGDKYGEFFTPSVGRADIWVFDTNNLGSAMGGTPETMITLFGDTPRALAVSPNGDKVYAGIFHSGNKTTITHEGSGLPPLSFSSPPSIATIVQFDGVNWVDSNNNIDTSIQLQLLDSDVFEIDATAALPAVTQSFSGVGTVLYNMAISPNTGKLYISNTEANNLIPNEPALTGNIHRARITVIDSLGTVAPRHINKHIDYSIIPSSTATRDASLATPMGMVIAADGSLYVTAFGSSKVGIFNTAQLDNDSFTPAVANHIDVTGGGPSGLVLDSVNNRLYVMTRFDNGISIIDRTLAAEIDHITLHNPEPAAIVDGRALLYDAVETSSNGEASCSSCHVFGQMDDLAWDLSDNLATAVIFDPNPFFPNPLFPIVLSAFHPMKGPMTTQSLRGMDNHGPMHWRGDRTGALSGSTFDDEDAAFKQFNPAFVGLLGRSTELSDAQMQAFTDFILPLSYPPNPIRNLDNSLTTDENAGKTLYHVPTTDIIAKCNDCHVLNESAGFFGTNGQSSFEAQPQNMKVPHLRNLYQKVGMFGAVPGSLFPSAGPANQPQVRGFGYEHNGQVDSLKSFTGSVLFNYPGDRATAIDQVSKFLLAFPTELAPIVGQQITLDATNAAAISARIDLFIQRAQTLQPNPTSPQQAECDLVVQGVVSGNPRGWLLNTSTVLFDPDHSAEAALTDAQLRALATAGVELTYTCAPPGSGHRIALDRDMDTLLNFNEIADLQTDPAKTDTDGDGIDDANDNCSLLANIDQRDSNGDGYGNICDIDLDQSGFVNSIDLGLFKTLFFTSDANADINGDGIVNVLDLGLMKNLFFKPVGPSAVAP